MKISGVDKNFNQAKVDDARSRQKVAVAKQSADGSKTSGSSQASAETVSVSGVGREIAKVKTAARQAPDIRREKVNAIKERISRGEYHVSGDKIAGKMIEDIVKNAR